MVAAATVKSDPPDAASNFVEPESVRYNPTIQGIGRTALASFLKNKNNINIALR
jgi:hypothetical protein